MDDWEVLPMEGVLLENDRDPTDEEVSPPESFYRHDEDVLEGIEEEER